jgi:hypothetical protein
VVTPKANLVTQRIAARVAARTLWAMTNVAPRLSGIPNVSIFMSEGTNEGKDLQHGPRVKVESLTGRFPDTSVTIGPNPHVVEGGPLPADVLKQVIIWIDLNRPMLMRLWTSKIDQQQAASAVKSVEHTEPVTFFHPSLEAIKRALLPGEFITGKRSLAKARGLDLAIEAGKDEFFVHQVLASVGDQVTRGGTSDVWNASERLPVTESKKFKVPVKRRKPPASKKRPSRK